MRGAYILNGLPIQYHSKIVCALKGITLSYVVAPSPLHQEGYPLRSNPREAL